MNFKKPKKVQKTINTRCFKDYKPETVRKELEESIKESNLEIDIEKKEVNKAMDELLNILQLTADKHAPMKEITLNNKQQRIPWFTPELKKKIEIKNKILNDWHLYGLQEDHKELKKMKNEINHLKVKLKREYYTNEIQTHEGNSKQTWKILKQALGIIEDKTPIEPDNVTKDKANEFNSFFASIGIEIQKNLKTKEYRTDFSNLKGFNFKPETEKMLLN